MRTVWAFLLTPSPRGGSHMAAVLALIKVSLGPPPNDQASAALGAVCKSLVASRVASLGHVVVMAAHNLIAQA